MDDVINIIDSNLLKSNVQLSGGITIPAKDFITYSVLPYLPSNNDISLKNGEIISLKKFIEEYVLTECIKNYNGNFKKYYEEVAIGNIKEIVNSTANVKFEDENKVDGMTKQTELELEKELESVEYSVSTDEKEPDIIVEKSGEVSILKKNNKGNLSFESKYLHTLKKSDNFELILELQSLQFSLALFDIVLFSNKNKEVSKVQTESNKVVSDFENVKSKIKSDQDLEYVVNYLKHIETIGTVGKFYSKPLLEKLDIKKEKDEIITTTEFIPQLEPIIEPQKESRLLPEVEELLKQIDNQDKLWDVFKDNVRYTSFDSKDKEEMIEKYKELLSKVNEYKVNNKISSVVAEDLIDNIEEKIESLSETQEFTGYGY